MIIDLHTHILPNIDDGAKSIEIANKMIEELLKQKIEKVVCTPHFYPTEISLQDFIQKRKEAMERMKLSPIPLIYGSETLLHEYLFHYSDLSTLCIGQKNYLLLEMPFTKKWDKSIYRYINKLLEYYNIIPIIAHVERYQAVKKNDKPIQKLKQMGCYIQLNVNSIIEKNIKDHVIHYLNCGYIDVLGSDCHNLDTRPPKIEEAINQIKKTIDKSYYQKLIDNSIKIIEGEKRDSFYSSVLL